MSKDLNCFKETKILKGYSPRAFFAALVATNSEEPNVAYDRALRLLNTISQKQLVSIGGTDGTGMGDQDPLYQRYNFPKICH